jgi:hypothetical protein
MDCSKTANRTATDEIGRVVYGLNHPGIARIYDVQKQFGVKIDGRKDPETSSLHWYKMRPVVVPVLPPAFDPPKIDLDKFPNVANARIESCELLRSGSDRIENIVVAVSRPGPSFPFPGDIANLLDDFFESFFGNNALELLPEHFVCIIRTAVQI